MLKIIRSQWLISFSLYLFLNQTIFLYYWVIGIRIIIKLRTRISACTKLLVQWLRLTDIWLHKRYSLVQRSTLSTIKFYLRAFLITCGWCSQIRIMSIKQEDEFGTFLSDTLVWMRSLQVKSHRKRWWRT